MALLESGAAAADAIGGDELEFTVLGGGEIGRGAFGAAYRVTVGGTLGHALCTGSAVVGGRILASRISEKAVATIAGFTFLAFAVHSFFYPDV